MVRPEFHRPAGVRECFGQTVELNVSACQFEVADAKPRVCRDGRGVRLRCVGQPIGTTVQIAQIEVGECLVRIERDGLFIRLACAGRPPGCRGPVLGAPVSRLVERPSRKR